MRLKKRHTDSGRLGFLAGRGAQESLVAFALLSRAGVAGRNRPAEVGAEDAWAASAWEETSSQKKKS